jgi:hypothetical protein
MKRRWFLIVGIFLVVGQIAVLVAFGVPPLSESSATATVGITALAGVLFAFGGTSRQFWSVEWYQFVGVAQMLIGLSFMVSMLLPILTGTSAYESDVQPLLAVAAAGGGMSIMFIGFDWIRGGRHFDLSSYESGPIFTSARR